MALGNHTFSHESLNETALADYQVDIVQAEPLLRFVQEPQGQRIRYFRAPHNHIGPTQEIKDGLARFLRSRRQLLAPFTIEHSDYAFDEVYRSALDASDVELASRVRSAYLEHLDAVFSFFEGLSAEMFDRQIAQVFLIHANRLNGEMLGEMLTRLEERGYRFVSLESALEDEAYSTPDHFVGPAGISWFHRWSYGRGHGSRTTSSGLRLPETLYREPDPPEFVLKAVR
jgi:peptidoglycan/xylan/chitin deacetylase (PgdA/CDA1 family)